MPVKITFGTDGWRGIIDRDINNKTIAYLAQAFSDYLINHSKEKDILKVAVAHDGRTHSRPWALLFARVLSGNNIYAYLSDRIVPTPLLGYFVKENKLNAGVMITASHNSAEFNGVKLKSNYGGPITTDQSLEIQSLIGNELIQADDEKIYQSDFLNGYYKHIEKLIDLNLIKESGLNILIDSMGGAGQQILETLFMKYEISSKTIFKICEKDFCGRKPEPIEVNLQPLKDELLRGSYSIGFGTDGDADRLGVMLETGEWLSVQETILLIADYIVNKRNIKGDIVKTSTVTDKLKQLFETEERKVIDVQVGFKNITQMIVDNDIAFGCEESGGFAIKGHLPDKDGLFSALLFTEMLASSGYTKLSEYVKIKRKEFGEIHFNRKDFEIDPATAAATIGTLFQSPPEMIGNYKVISFKEFYTNTGKLNGLRFSFEDNARWLLIRTSETEPLLRIYAEGGSDEEVNSFIETGWEYISSVKTA